MLSHYDSLKDNTVHYLGDTNYKSLDNLMKFVKYIEGRNPYDLKKNETMYLMWREQCILNFPILYVASIALYIYAKKHNCKHFLFATRDCCHWQKIFKAIFPDENSHYFNCSRAMFEGAIANKNKDYKKYVKSLIGDDVEHTIYIDIHGTGKRAFKYFENAFGKLPFCFILSAKYHNYKNFPKAVHKYHRQGKLINLVFESRGSPIEMLNYDLVGTMTDYNSKEGPIRSRIEYNRKLVRPYHDCISYIVDKIKPLKTDNIENEYKLKKLIKLIDKIFTMIKIDKPVISKYINHIGNHQKPEKYLVHPEDLQKNNK